MSEWEQSTNRPLSSGVPINLSQFNSQLINIRIRKELTQSCQEKKGEVILTDCIFGFLWTKRPDILVFDSVAQGLQLLL